MYSVINKCLLDFIFFFFSSRRRHTRLVSDWSSDVCSSDLARLDVEGTCAFLEQTYWGKTRPRQVMLKSFRNSVCFGVYRSEERRVGKECRSRWSQYH